MALPAFFSSFSISSRSTKVRRISSARAAFFCRKSGPSIRIRSKIGFKTSKSRCSQLSKLNFQVLRRSIATLAQTKGNVKDVQGILGHTKADTTVNVYMQQIEEGVKLTLDAIYAELTAGPKLVAVA